MFVYSQKVHAFHFTVMKQLKWIHYRPQRSWGKVIFSEACVNNSGPRGACMVARGGVRGFIWGGCVVLFGGHVWFYSVGGRAWFYSAGGACVVLFRGRAWFYSVGGGMCGFIQRGGMHGFIQGGHAWFFQFFRIQ